MYDATVVWCTHCLSIPSTGVRGRESVPTSEEEVKEELDPSRWKVFELDCVGVLIEGEEGSGDRDSDFEFERPHPFLDLACEHVIENDEKVDVDVDVAGAAGAFFGFLFGTNAGVVSEDMKTSMTSASATVAKAGPEALTQAQNSDFGKTDPTPRALRMDFAFALALDLDFGSETLRKLEELSAVRRRSVDGETGGFRRGAFAVEVNRRRLVLGTLGMQKASLICEIRG
ncbi:hypothetical protein BT96DRAFT_1097254 [Gymnopus androsaceus JB14]|uniref:Uncharacterized protein n=1 Tax=Gymnopus androsaceus JB14 TaxID=1447944 RepID=A0A6A4HRL8_9AGAR|nr:hypothetical protein BT96DRAFT_1097254 [Gymnopus androsaceus JB14]